jgi:hypothetical protein
MTDLKERERAEFEKVAIERTWPVRLRKDGEYEDGCAFIGWIVWQAACREERKRCETIALEYGSAAIAHAIRAGKGGAN